MPRCRIRSAALFALLVASSAAAGEPAPASPGQALFQEGRSLERAGWNSDAYARYGEAVKAEPSMFEAWRARLDVAEALGGEALEEVADECGRLLDEQPDSAFANLVYGRLDWRQPGKSLRFLLRAAELDPKFHWAWLELGRAYAPFEQPCLRMPGDIPENAAKAVEFFGKAVALKPGSSEALAGLGFALYDAGKFGDCAAWFGKAAAADPASIPAASGLALIALDEGRPKEGADLLRKALRAPDAADEALKKRIDELVAQLGSEDSAARDDAGAELERIGAPALPALQKATTNPDLEIQLRAKQLIETIPTWLLHLDGLSMLVRCMHASGQHADAEPIRATLMKASQAGTILDKRNLGKRPALDAFRHKDFTLLAVENLDKETRQPFSVFLFAVYQGADRRRPDLVSCHCERGRIVTVDHEQMGLGYFLEETSERQHSTYMTYGDRKPTYAEAVARVKKIFGIP